jgi:DNA-binding transcriptional regulator YhcF (GntR family)
MARPWEAAGVNAREKIWAWIEVNRQGGPEGSHVLHASPRQIAEATGVGLEWVRTIMEQWRDEGCLTRIESKRYRIVEAPKLNGFTRHPVWSEEARGKLAELSARGLTLAEMAREMKVTLNAVAGQRNRLGLPKRPSPIRRAAEGP